MESKLMEEFIGILESRERFDDSIKKVRKLDLSLKCDRDHVLSCISYVLGIRIRGSSEMKLLRVLHKNKF